MVRVQSWFKVDRGQLAGEVANGGAATSLDPGGLWADERSPRERKGHDEFEARDIL
jgi:hypothetical protein